MLESELFNTLPVSESETTINGLHVPDVPVAFFDLDHTILNRDLNLSWIRWRLRNTWRGVLESFIGLHNYVDYKRGKLSARSIYLYYWARTFGLSYQEYKRLSHDFFHEQGKYHIAPEAVELINAHKEAANKVVIITAQDDFMACLFYDYLNIDSYISNRKIFENDKFVGMESPNCYGEGKIELAKNYLEKLAVSISDCAFYSDSISDLPLLETVKYPIAVNPDFKLEKKALDSNWPVYKF